MPLLKNKTAKLYFYHVPIRRDGLKAVGSTGGRHRKAAEEGGGRTGTWRRCTRETTALGWRSDRESPQGRRSTSLRHGHVLSTSGGCEPGTEGASTREPTGRGPDAHVGRHVPACSSASEGQAALPGRADPRVAASSPGRAWGFGDGRERHTSHLPHLRPPLTLPPPPCVRTPSPPPPQTRVRASGRAASSWCHEDRGSPNPERQETPGDGETGPGRALTPLHLAGSTCRGDSPHACIEGRTEMGTRAARARVRTASPLRSEFPSPTASRVRTLVTDEGPSTRHSSTASPSPTTIGSPRGAPRSRARLRDRHARQRPVEGGKGQEGGSSPVHPARAAPRGAGSGRRPVCGRAPRPLSGPCAGQHGHCHHQRGVACFSRPCTRCWWPALGSRP